MSLLNSSPHERLRILGVRIDRVSSHEALSRVRKMAASGEPHHVITGNTLMLLAAESDPELSQIIEDAALVVPESWGTKWASRKLGQPLLEFFPGIDFMIRLCEQAREDNHSVYLLGAQPGVADATAEKLLSRFPGLRIVGTHHGYFSEKEVKDVIALVRSAAPYYLFVAMNVPGQEKWIARHLQALKVPVVMGVGGSFDVLSGRLKRAPRWMRRIGLEWVFRTLQQPWRLQRIRELPVFMRKVRAEKRERRS